MILPRIKPPWKNYEKAGEKKKMSLKIDTLKQILGPSYPY